jgi:hypothetical protein
MAPTVRWRTRSSGPRFLQNCPNVGVAGAFLQLNMETLELMAIGGDVPDRGFY